MSNPQHNTKFTGWTRREFVKYCLGAIGTSSLVGTAGVSKLFAARPRSRVMVLGIDGMDPNLLRHYMASGKMPNARKLTAAGGFAALETSMPAQSPVAWSNFITGMNPGGHGIFDFIHREPETFKPYLSTSKSIPARNKISVGDWQLPLAADKVKLLRQGRPFWSILEENGEPCTVFRVPANFPPENSGARTLAGMGTPDILGGYGSFSYYTNVLPENSQNISGGRIFPIRVKDNTVVAHLEGPPNAYRRGRPQCRVPFTVRIDPQHPVAKIEVQGREILLRQGEWSDWQVVEFEMVPILESVSAICRIFVQELHPDFKLYISPLNINPADPSMPLSTPPDYSKELFDKVGYFHTQGMPEDTKALSNDIFTDQEYLDQALFVLEERRRLYNYELDQFQSGFFFFYFSSLDQNSHMFWRTLDSSHPLYSPELGRRFGWVIPYLYQKMDEVIGKAMSRMDDRTTLIVMSDHGFSSFRRGFNLNTWLLNNGYAALHDPLSQEDTEFYDNVDWVDTTAYGLGINGLYLNLDGRERQGTVPAGETSDRLIDEIAKRLEQVKDPHTGENIISHAYRPGQIYSGEHLDKAPDLILGYNRYYRSSWETILGKYPRDEFVDNVDKWSGDHCIDNIFIPGVLMCNKRIQKANPALQDLAPSILAEFGVEKTNNMTGGSIF